MQPGNFFYIFIVCFDLFCLTAYNLVREIRKHFGLN
jgi:hypothetical protein